MGQDTYQLGPLEMKILGLLEKDAPASVHAIQHRLKRSGEDLAYTTVMTVLSRLYKKGALKREKEGRQFLYSQAKVAATFKSHLLTRLQQSLFRNNRLKPILALLDSDDELSADELRELRNAVDQKLKKTQKS